MALPSTRTQAPSRHAQNHAGLSPRKRAKRTRRREHYEAPQPQQASTVAELAGVAFVVMTFFAAALFL